MHRVDCRRVGVAARHRRLIRHQNDAESCTTQPTQRQRRAGLELWVDEESHARRAAGEVVCGTSLDLGRLRLDCAFLRWHMEGREGVGRYDILRRVG
jgi:hypothetical protein